MEWQNLTPEQRESARRDFAKDCNECPRCGALFHHEQGHVWSGTLKKGNALDLAGLVCNPAQDDRCINPCKGRDGGQTFESRKARIGLYTQEVKWALEEVAS